MNSFTERDVADTWDENAALWVSQVAAGRDAFREIVNNPMFFGAFLPDLRGREVIDLGCGEGCNTRILAQRGGKMTGIDISPRMIASARAAEASEPLGIDYRVGSFAALDGIDDASVDAAISTMALMDAPDFGAAATATFRVLRDGGGFHFSVIHPCFCTLGSRWIRDAEDRAEGRLVGNYWNEQPYIEEWRFSLVGKHEAQPFKVPTFPYRLEHYVNGLCEAGFRITGILEPRPTEAMVAAYPDWLGEVRRHAPIHLYVSAAKP
jgi:SAM-dependent methyltransferase